MESTLDQMTVIIEMVKSGERIPAIQGIIKEQFRDPIPKKLVSAVVKKQRLDMKAANKPFERAREMVRENPDISASELEKALPLSLSSCYKVLRQVKGPSRKKRWKSDPAVKSEYAFMFFYVIC